MSYNMAEIRNCPEHGLVTHDQYGHDNYKCRLCQGKPNKQ